ncbi:MAG: hypothetical protein IT366_24245 [Candidatus Hydrogenedentes bacterium]|nr:hypothetical protein [Candidatus Hydrogenedentota bacterium]
MTYRGHIENGVVILDEPLSLPDGTTVSVEPVSAELEAQYAALREGLLRLAGTIDDMPPDMSENLDHYLYGCPRK